MPKTVSYSTPSARGDVVDEVVQFEWAAAPEPPTRFTYERWRHGGWYVNEVRYPSGACGCVSRNYEDGKWRIVCDPRPFEEQPTFPNRDTAALAEWYMAEIEKLTKGAAHD